MKDKLTLLLMAMLCAFFAPAQQVTGSLTGDSGPIEFANIVLFNYADSSVITTVASGEIGDFSLKTNKKDSVFIQVFYSGFMPYSSTVFVGAKQFNEIVLEADNELDTLTISYKKPFREMSAHGSTFNIDGNPIMQNGSADRMIRRLPGVEIRQGKSIAVNGKNNATVYINGKKSYLEEADVIEYLETIPADQILKVEVYDSPPARFDAQGNGAIINIIIKKPPLGTNGRVNSFLGIHTDFKGNDYFKMGTGFNINHRTEKFNFYGGIKVRTYEIGNVSNDSTIFDSDKNHYLSNQSSYYNKWVSNSVKMGLDYYPNDKTTLGIYVDYLYNAAINTNLTANEIELDVITDYTSFDSDEVSDNDNSMQNFNLDFNRTINDSVNFSSDIVYVRLSSNDDMNTQNNLFQGNTLFGTTMIKSKSKSNINILAVKANYSGQLKKKWKIDAGVKYSYIFNDNKFLSYTGTKPDDLSLDVNLSNDFEYQESIAAGYLSIQKNWSEKFATDIGARVEQTNVSGVSPTEDLKFTKDYFNVFPNISFSYKPSKKHHFSLLYTERIDRPNTTELNPFLKSTNELEYESGNPDLNPSLDKLINFKYTFLEALTFVVEAGKKYDYYANVKEQDINTGIATELPSNIGTGEYVSLNLGSPIPIADYWMGYVQLHYLFAELNAPPNHFKVNKFYGYIGNEITLPKDWTVSISGYYAYNPYFGTWILEPLYAARFNVIKKIGKWSVGLEIYDFLDTKFFKSSTEYNGIKSTGSSKWESRSFWFDITYRFGNNKIEKKRDRNVGEDENGRVE